MPLNKETKPTIFMDKIYFNTDHIYQPLRSGRIWHKVSF